MLYKNAVFLLFLVSIGEMLNNNADMYSIMLYILLLWI